MPPKYRGDDEDWLDEEASRAQGRSAPRDRGAADKRNQAEALEPDKANGTVAEVFPGQCRVRRDDAVELSCRYRRAAVYGHHRENTDAQERERSPVAVGDRVLIETIGGPLSREGIVAGVCRRRNRLVRPAPDRDESLRHVIAANVDVLVIVASVSAPDFTPGLVDRFLIAAQAESIVPVLAVTKADLLADEGPKPWDVYRDIGIETHELAAKRGLGVDLLRERLEGKTVVFCGKSGVGKTSLLNVLTRGGTGRVGNVSEATGKGKHTTTSAILLPGTEGTNWIDTPGVRELGLVNVLPEDLARYYPELGRAGCAAEDCAHLGEPGCAAESLPRYASFRRVRESLEQGEN